jgi:hypothetical protein
MYQTMPTSSKMIATKDGASAVLEKMSHTSPTQKQSDASNM